MTAPNPSIGAPAAAPATHQGVPHDWWLISAAVSDHLDELEEQTPLASLRPVDRNAQVFAANVYGSSAAAYLSGRLLDRQTDRHPTRGVPAPADLPVRPSHTKTAISVALTDDRDPESAPVFETAAGLVWNHLAWVPNHDWEPIAGAAPGDHYGSPAWRSRGRAATFADDLVIGPATDYYPSARINSLLIYWRSLLRNGFQGLRVLSALEPDTNVWVWRDGVTVPIRQAPPFARRVHDVPGSALPTSTEDAQVNPWRSALLTMHVLEQQITT